jgi:hypothetical protein
VSKGYVRYTGKPTNASIIQLVVYGGSYMFQHNIEEQQPPEHNPIYILGSVTY